MCTEVMPMIAGTQVPDEPFNVGVVASSGGSALDCALEVLGDLRKRFRFSLVTDRECGAEEVARRWGVSNIRLTGRSNDEFSASAATWLKDEQGAQGTLLYYSRLVSAPLFEALPCVNFHPSLLPAFSGLGAVSAQSQSTVRIVGATAHFVDESIDGGPIVAQVAALRPIPTKDPSRAIERLQFGFKVYLTLAILERAAIGDGFGLSRQSEGRCSPSPPELASMPLLDPELRLRFCSILERADIPWSLHA